MHTSMGCASCSPPRSRLLQQIVPRYTAGTYGSRFCLSKQNTVAEILSGMRSAHLDLKYLLLASLESLLVHNRSVPQRSAQYGAPSVMHACKHLRSAW